MGAVLPPRGTRKDNVGLPMMWPFCCSHRNRERIVESSRAVELAFRPARNLLIEKI